MSESAAIAITTVLFILVIVDIVGNTLVCAVIKSNRDMRIPMNYLLINLAIADILYAVFIIPRVFFKLPYAYHPNGVFGTVVCKGGSVAWTGSASSLVTFVAIAVERYCAVVYPYGNKLSLTKNKLKVIIPGTWIFALLFDLPPYIVKDVVEKKSGNACVSLWPESWMGKAFNLTWLVGMFLSLLLMIGLYSRVVYSLWFKRYVNGQLTQQQLGVMRVRKRVTLMVVTVTSIYGVCWSTGILVYVLWDFVPENIGTMLLAIADVMILFNSAVNPFVYALLNHQFRGKMKKMICGSSPSVPEVYPTPEVQDKELADLTSWRQPTHTVK